MQRSPINLPLWAEFAGLTLVVTIVLLTLGLTIRGLVTDEPGAVELMQVEKSPPPEVILLKPQASSPKPPPEASVIAQPVEAPQTAVTPTFDGRPIRPVRTLSMQVTAYSPDHRSCGKWADGTTASGYSVWTNGMKLIAADTSILPFGTILTVPGYNGEQPAQILDRGGKIKGHRLDVLYPTHEIARRWGNQQLTVTIWEYAD